MRERLMEFIKEKDISNRKFLLKCGLSGTYINTLTGNPSGDTIKKIEAAYPELNTDWLLTGEGEMLKIPATLTIYNPTAEEGNTMSEGVDMSVVPAEVVEEIKEEIRAEIEEAESVPLVSSKVANDITINVRKFVEKRGDEMERIKPNDLVGDADIAERIRKGSMMPTFMPGDIVFVRFIDDKKIISDGHTYYFDLKGRPTIIRKVKIEGSQLRLIAENPTFGDIITNFDEVENVADIVGMFRNYFTNQYAEIEEVRRKKDEQIDKLVEQNSEALKSINNLISVIKHNV
jgi:phage repressor protein C with HTH and peptisase S24 domain